MNPTIEAIDEKGLVTFNIRYFGRASGCGIVCIFVSILSKASCEADLDLSLKREKEL